MGEGTGKRDELEALIQSKKDAIETLKEEIIELRKETILLSDEKQWFKEEMETITYRENRKKVSVDKLVGRRYWNEDFMDEDTKEVITIERCQVVRVDGIWE